jgi:hypothetical protein
MIPKTNEKYIASCAISSNRSVRIIVGLAVNVSSTWTITGTHDLIKSVDQQLYWFLQPKVLHTNAVLHNPNMYSTGHRYYCSCAFHH